MTKAEYGDHVRAFLQEMQSVTEAKNVDYSAGQEDAMANYYELAAATGVTPRQAWMVLFMKHITAIMRWAKSGSVVSEPIRGRFIDVANYAMLGDALERDLQARKAAAKTCPPHKWGPGVYDNMPDGDGPPSIRCLVCGIDQTQVKHITAKEN